MYVEADAFLYVLPETHTNKDHQKRKETLTGLASWGGINVLLESVLFHDASGQSSNLYGIEEERSAYRSQVLLHYIKSVKAAFPAYKEGDKTAFDTARREAKKELASYEQKGYLVPRNPKSTSSNVEQDLTDFIENFPESRMDEIEERYLFYKRNHKIANCIKDVLGQVLRDPKASRVFVLSIGAKHIDSSQLTSSEIEVGKKYAGKKDLPTILGSSVVVSGKRVDIIYGDTPLKDIAQKALDLGDNLGTWTKIKAFPALKYHTW